MGYFLDGKRKESGMDLLNDEGKALAENYIRLLANSGEYERFPSEEDITDNNDTENIVDINLYLLAASAGTGQYLDGEAYETIRLPERLVPKGTDFAIRIAGDSMEPAFYSEQIAFVKSTVALNPGDIGIFVVDGESYVKKYSEIDPEQDELEDYMFSTGNVQKKPVLISLNEMYSPIRIGRDQKFRIVGKVLNRTGVDLQ